MSETFGPYGPPARRRRPFRASTDLMFGLALGSFMTLAGFAVGRGIQSTAKPVIEMAAVCTMPSTPTPGLRPAGDSPPLFFCALKEVKP